MSRVGITHQRLGVLLAAVLMLVALCTSVYGSDITGSPRTIYSKNQVLVTLKPGSSPADLAGLLAETGGKVMRRLPLLNTYAIELPGDGTPSDQFIAKKSTILNRYQYIKALQYNYAYYPMAVPNDQYFSVGVDSLTGERTGQWPLQPDPLNTGIQHIYAPEAWDIEKGSSNVVVAVLDTGIRERNAAGRIPHPDLADRLLTGFDIADLDSDPSPSETAEGADHGTHVAGIIAAQGNNSIGVTGVCWDGVWILPVKVFFDEITVTYDDVVAEAILACISWSDTEHSTTAEPLRVNVINMSLGGPGRSDLMANAVRLAAQNGIVMAASAGNDWEYGAYPPYYPAAYDEVICVGATEYADTITSFSQHGSAMDLVAPGYQVLSTVWAPPGTVPPGDIPRDSYGNGYDYYSGTSMAAPHVAGAAALLMSQGVPAADVQQILQETATRKGSSVPNDTYGWGLINLYQALQTASIEVEIESPANMSVATTTRPTIRIDFRGADISTIRVILDSELLIGPKDESPTIGYLSLDAEDESDPYNVASLYYFTLNESARKTYLLFKPQDSLSQGTDHVLSVSATMEGDTSAEPLTDSDSVTFRVNPQVLGRGWHMFSIPKSFESGTTPQDIMGDEGLLARWNYADGIAATYALYSLDGSRVDEESSFAPPSVLNNQLTYSLSTPMSVSHPAGLGYWFYVPDENGIPVPDTSGVTLEDAPFVIGLYKGWNMVGNPFPFVVDWGGVLVEKDGVRKTTADAVAAGWIYSRAYRYAYDSESGSWDYQVQTVNSGYMLPWEAQWVRVRTNSATGWPAPDVKLIVSPNPSNIATQ